MALTPSFKTLTLICLGVILAGCAQKTAAPLPDPVASTPPAHLPAAPPPMVLTPAHPVVVMPPPSEADRQAFTPSGEPPPPPVVNRAELTAKIAAVDAQIDTLKDDFEGAKDRGEDIYSQYHYHARYEQLMRQKAAYQSQLNAVR